MRRSRTSTSIALALAGLAAAAAGPLAASAPVGAATVIPGGPIAVVCPVLLPTTPATDLIKLTGIGVDFGKNGLNASNDPTCSSTVRWDTTGNTITPTITGDIILKNSLGVSARVIASYYDVHGTSLGPSRVTSTKVGTTNAVQSFPITINGFSSPLVYEVSIATQVLAGGVWVDVDREAVFLSSSNQAPDSVSIAAVGQDFGVNGLVGGAPAAPGTLSWDLSGNTTKAVLAGDLIMTNSLGVSARMRVKTYDVHGVQLSSTPGATKSPNTNAQTSFPINLASPPNPLIFKAVTNIEVLVGGNWVPVGPTVTSYI